MSLLNIKTYMVFISNKVFDKLQVGAPRTNCSAQLDDLFASKKKTSFLGLLSSVHLEQEKKAHFHHWLGGNSNTTFITTSAYCSFHPTATSTTYLSPASINLPQLMGQHEQGQSSSQTGLKRKRIEYTLWKGEELNSPDENSPTNADFEENEGLVEDDSSQPRPKSSKE
ncbi:hypothetical protein FZEAL_5759 [Fusarium zealandicum]|uniref:Uncharacterized protein n=1 Tax=Fusarium zealandicum TaxID=1053134 RepID=A0A8H4UK72_9HYPO|nr:hypothetical protein FZEAL_5759 [Fusarium zealandicum]